MFTEAKQKMKDGLAVSLEPEIVRLAKPEVHEIVLAQPNYSNLQPFGLLFHKMWKEKLELMDSKKVKFVMMQLFNLCEIKSSNQKIHEQK